LNALYKNYPALHEKQFSNDGFEWISYADNQNCVISFIRKGNNPKDDLLIVCNFTPVVREQYRIGVSGKVKATEVFNSDAKAFGGSGVLNPKPIAATASPWNGRDFSIEATLPPLGITVFSLK
ncbi:MAG: 1,4-alpha-glucan branching enzyme, partial [Chitinophagaceae bacterium]